MLNKKVKPKANYPQVVVALIFDLQNRLLVSQRSLDSAAPGKWQNPGGKVEIGETHEKALEREVKEETGMDIKTTSRPLFRFSDHENKFEVYLFKVEATGQPKVKEPSKLNSEWIYLEMNELRRKKIVPALSELLKKINNL